MTVDNPEVFLDVRFMKLALVCTRPACSVQAKAGPNRAPKMRDLVIELPERCLPEDAVLLRAQHLATHVEPETEVQEK